MVGRLDAEVDSDKVFAASRESSGSMRQMNYGSECIIVSVLYTSCCLSRMQAQMSSISVMKLWVQ